MSGLEIGLIAAVCALAVACVVLALVLLRERGGGSQLLSDLEGIDRGVQRLESVFREELKSERSAASDQAAKLRVELSESAKRQGDSLVKSVGEISGAQKTQLEAMAERINKLTESNEKRLETLREVVERRLRILQEDNAKKLDQMRQTVDEKLQGTLEKRLGESFKLVSERLEQVYKGLGEMRTLASGVGDLKRVLSNVKTRGTLAEIQLGSLLEQVLSPEQYASNIATVPGSGNRVEFAIKLPARDDDEDGVVWLPIDAKFPKEDYQRLIDAQERGDLDGVSKAGNQLESQIKSSARSIRDKYVSSPHTTEFALMFLGTEGLYAEVIRRPGLFEHLQREYRVVAVGPSTLAALLNSLQMGFRTLAVQKRSGEVWRLLSVVKQEFGKFGGILDGVKKKLQEASNKIEDASRKSRTIERKLRDVESLPAVAADPSPTDKLLPDDDSRPDEKVLGATDPSGATGGLSASA